MFQTFYDIAIGDRAGILNRIFTIVSVALLLFQVWRQFSMRMKINQWRYRFLLLEREAREEGVATITDPHALPPTDSMGRMWNMIPSMAMMFGLLGTFVGLTLSLSEIPVTGEIDAIQKGLSRAIPSMGTAFMTSLCGLLVALFVRLTNSSLASEYRKKVIEPLLNSEPQVIEAMEVAAFQKGWEGAFLRPNSLKELLWHKHRELNQTFRRLGPEINEGLARTLHKIQEKQNVSNSPSDAFLEQTKHFQKQQEQQWKQWIQIQQQFQQQLIQVLQQNHPKSSYYSEEEATKNITIESLRVEEDEGWDSK